MTKTLELKLDDETSVFVEVEEASADRRQLVAKGDDKLEANFSKVSASLAGIVRSMEAQLEKLPARPDQVELEMGAQLKGNADLWLVSGEASGHMKVKLTWKSTAGA